MKKWAAALFSIQERYDLCGMKAKKAYRVFYTCSGEEEEEEEAASPIARPPTT